MRPRGGGKTYYAVRFVMEHPRAVLVVPTLQRKRWILEQYDPLGLNGLSNRIFSLEQATNRGPLPPRAEIVVDNTEEILETLFQRPVVLATADSSSRRQEWIPFIPSEAQSRFLREGSWEVDPVAEACKRHALEAKQKIEATAASLREKDLRKTFGLQPR